MMQGGTSTGDRNMDANSKCATQTHFIKRLLAKQPQDLPITPKTRRPSMPTRTTRTRTGTKGSSRITDTSWTSHKGSSGSRARRRKADTMQAERGEQARRAKASDPAAQEADAQRRPGRLPRGATSTPTTRSTTMRRASSAPRRATTTNVESRPCRNCVTGTRHEMCGGETLRRIQNVLSNAAQKRHARNLENKPKGWQRRQVGK